ncbi:RNA polymerase sigma factor [Nannocystis radixulma]|uniref:Sigma-70 family RNA polymerase sigma factor n=1 Tax=Nannocystis radixulma TaxID=2995305 RepID=A0ABT5BJL1_9BACT|nr:sigma-70 family RNA polymerase sigma factor [Nannocystis radixulma]MDC0674323.1 sigma-70 family RNA polymerase sigma factor [Nannocystis radixulma]
MQLTDREARFRAIYDREFPFVWAAARYFGIPAAARDDVVQDVFLTAFRRFDQIHYQVSARAWLYGVTRRIASHYHRGAARHSRRIAAFGEFTGSPGEAPHERHDSARVLERLLARLPRGARDVWELTELLGMSGPEIAAELDLPLNTVYSRLRLARAQLHELAASPELLAAARRRDDPPPAAAERTWAVMLPLLTPAKFATVAAAWATARTGVMTTLLLAGATAVVAAAPPRQARDRAAETALSPETSDSARPATAAPPLASGLSPETSESAGAPPAPAVPDLSRETSGPAGHLSQGPARSAGYPFAGEVDGARANLSQGTARNASDALAAEVALLDRARARLDARDPAAAAQLLATHAREFPRGALVDAREAAAVEVLCLQGRPADAAAAAQRLAARLPDSVLARRFERFVCPDAPAPTETGAAGDESGWR